MADLSPVQRALLETISGPESSGSYNVLYGGNHFNSYADHPRQAVTITSGPNKGLTSSAAGKYQFLGSTWDEQAQALGLTDFSPENQDRAAWHLAETEYRRDTGRDLTSDLEAGDLSRVPSSLRNQWTSMPGGIEQGITGGGFNAAFSRALGTAPAAAPKKPTVMSMVGGGINNLINTVGAQAKPLMVRAGAVAENALPAAALGALGTLPGRSAVVKYLMNRNVADAPMMVSGFKPGGTQVLTTGGQQGTLMRATDGRVGGVSSLGFDARNHAGQNMDVYRANAAAVGGPGNLNAAGINAALGRGASLVRVAPGAAIMRSGSGGGGGQSLSTMSGERSFMER